jgi:hypothetical protein
MNATGWIRISLVAAAAALTHSTALGTESAPAKAALAQPDRSRDFDFLVGSWNATLHRLEKPLTGSTKWVEMHGKLTMRKILGGPANTDEMIVENPETGASSRGFTVRVYDSALKDWRIYWSPPTGGNLGLPVIGHFENGEGNFYDQEEWNGRMIFVHYRWHDISENAAHFEQSFSVDGGKTWEVNWKTSYTRESK